MTSPVQLDLFAESEAAAERPPVVYRADPAKVRVKLLDVLATLRASSRIPWDERRAQYWRTVFPQMTNWLPPDEAAELKGAFAEEMKRLGS